jgi:transposase-like protein
MAEDRKRGLTPEQWAEVRSAFESGESIKSLAARFGVKRDTIAARRDRAPWVIKPGTPIGHVPGIAEARAVREQVKSNVVAIASHESYKRLEESGVIEDMIHGFEMDVKFERELLEFASAVLEKARSGRLRPGAITSEAAESKDVVAMGKTALEVRRLGAGKTAGEPTVERNVTGTGVTIVTQRLEPRKIAVDEKGRQIA